MFWLIFFPMFFTAPTIFADLTTFKGDTVPILHIKIFLTNRAAWRIQYKLFYSSPSFVGQFRGHLYDLTKFLSNISLALHETFKAIELALHAQSTWLETTTVNFRSYTLKCLQKFTDCFVFFPIFSLTFLEAEFKVRECLYVNYSNDREYDIPCCNTLHVCTLSM